MADVARPTTTTKPPDVNIWAATIANDYATVERLLRDGVAANERNSLGETALHLAASRGYDDLLSLLLRHGGSPHMHDKESGYTPLHRSLLYDHINTSLLLLNAGAHLTVEESSAVVDHDGLAPMDLLSAKLSATYPHQMASTRGGEIYTFGKVDFQLGYHLPHGDEQVMPRRVKLPPKTDIVQIAAARYHTLVVSSSGECFSWGFGKGGRLGTGTEFNCIHPVPVPFPQRTVVKVAAGENHSLALTTGGQIFSWGSNSFGQLGFPLKLTSASSRLSPKRIDAFKGVVVVDIAASSVHSVALTESGHVFSWGSNKKGQLGRKEGFGTDQGFPSPKRVDALMRTRRCSATSRTLLPSRSVVAVSCNHTCIVLNVEKETSAAVVQGQVWQWGYNAYFPSQVLLRHVSKESRLRQHHRNLWVPRCQQHAISIVDISCAPQHSIGLSASGNVYTWGHGPGVQSPSINYVPLAHRAVSVCAAKEHCAVVLATGDVYTWGCGSLGHEGRNWQPVPKRVPRLKRASAVAAGPQHTVVLVAPDRPPLVPTTNELPTLAALCEESLAAQLSLENFVQTYNHADAIYATALLGVCNDFARRNWDAVLDMAKDLEEFPIHLEEAAQSTSATDALTQTRKPTREPTRKPRATMAPHEVEKRLRALAKRLRQIDDLETLDRWTDVQAEKMARKPFILEEIDVLERHLEKVRAAPPPPSSPVVSPEVIVADGPKIHDVVDTRPLTAAPPPAVVVDAKLKGKRESPREKTSKEHRPAEKESRKAAKESLKVETKTKKTKTKFVPLDTFLLSTPVPPPMAKAVVTPVWNSPPPPRPIKAPAAIGSSKSGPTFSLEAFVKTKGPKKPAPKQSSPMWSAVPAPAAVPSLTAIQSSQVVEVTQSWNLRENSWGLCQEENVKLEDVQTLALIEKLLAEDAAALAAMEQQQQQERQKTTTNHRSKTKSNAFRKSRKATQAA
ncbi:hypothetical protein SPRG_08502 [Saprolegnia parasitica CBS 223.65]|uniref:RCC1-like domain-containing protein n=1 Tax=Saprolegnia parasitica (strain CBS 223.65) TaxID=695850 RepID=A0A067CHX3_SAPPC|nr:hypothetical protein SPRG_08502 [Saprolegnia parasitica CBS 223.65]KDO26141.1 hypothetical protein SPRG_08502 [Saprolegnia parasitica CBS 223.65]|eukprot:XP_012203135.1 hypothetical protein SPRG_08502 [Saprolegnia parasitica CBS 223.65]